MSSRGGEGQKQRILLLKVSGYVVCLVWNIKDNIFKGGLKVFFLIMIEGQFYRYFKRLFFREELFFYKGIRNLLSLLKVY